MLRCIKAEAGPGRTRRVSGCWIKAKLKLLPIFNPTIPVTLQLLGTPMAYFCITLIPGDILRNRGPERLKNSGRRSSVTTPLLPRSRLINALMSPLVGYSRSLFLMPVDSLFFCHLRHCDLLETVVCYRLDWFRLGSDCPLSSVLTVICPLCHCLVCSADLGGGGGGFTTLTKGDINKRRKLLSAET